MDNIKITRAIVAQTDLNFALIAVILKIVDHNSELQIPAITTALNEVLEKNSEVVNVIREIASHASKEGFTDG